MKFHFARIPEIILHSGAIERLPELIDRFGSKVLIISDPGAVDLSNIQSALAASNVGFQLVEAGGEPSPQQIDQIVAD